MRPENAAAPKSTFGGEPSAFRAASMASFIKSSKAFWRLESVNDNCPNASRLRMISLRTSSGDLPPACASLYNCVKRAPISAGKLSAFSRPGGSMPSGKISFSPNPVSIFTMSLINKVMPGDCLDTQLRMPFCKSVSSGGLAGRTETVEDALGSLLFLCNTSSALNRASEPPISASPASITSRSSCFAIAAFMRAPTSGV